MKTYVYLAVILLELATGCRGWADLLFHETFSYADGPLVQVAAGGWRHHSGHEAEAAVLGGQLQLTQGASEDVHAVLAGGPYATNGPAVLYAALSCTFQELPKGPSGGYFAHFKDAATGFRGRLFATTNEAAPGRLRLGISAGANTASVWHPRELELGTTCCVVLRYGVSNAETTLWLDPVAETDPGVTSTDVGGPIAVTAIAFRQSLSSGNGMGALAVDEVSVATSFSELSAGPSVTVVPPVVLVQPQGRVATVGETVQFNVEATGDPPLSYQWYYNDEIVPGATNSVLLFPQVTSVHAGFYYVQVSNLGGQISSDAACLEIQAVAEPREVTIAALRAMVGPPDFELAATTECYAVEGVVVTRDFLRATATERVFFLQDGEAGIAVCWTGGGSWPWTPRWGDRVRVMAPLEQRNGLLRLAPREGDPRQAVSWLGESLSVPAPLPLSLASVMDTGVMEGLEGCRVVVTNVYLDMGLSSFPEEGRVWITNRAGHSCEVEIVPGAGLGGQSKPGGPLSIVGVLSQLDEAAPFTEGYVLVPLQRADLQSESRPPSILWTNRLEAMVYPGDLATNTYTELVLRPGEKLRVTVAVKAVDGERVGLEVRGDPLPPQAHWEIPVPYGLELEAEFTFEPVPADAGHHYGTTLKAANAGAANDLSLDIYVPTPAEQEVVLSEFLANPTSDPEARGYNPLRRSPPSGQAGLEDEFLELVNFGGQAVDLGGWTIADGQDLRHEFPLSFLLGSSNAVVVFGGLTPGGVVDLETPAFPASIGAEGLALSDAGQEVILVRNAEHRLIMRVVYQGEDLPQLGSLLRYPERNGPFIAHAQVSASLTSPGLRPNGQRFAGPSDSAIRLHVICLDRETIRLEWPCTPGLAHTVWVTDDLKRPFQPLATDLRYTTSTAAWIHDCAAECPTRFYRVSVP